MRKTTVKMKLSLPKLKKDFDDFEILSPIISLSKHINQKPFQSPGPPQETRPSEPINTKPTNSKTSNSTSSPSQKSKLKTKIIQMFKTKKPNQLKRSASTFDLIRSYPLQFRF